MLIYIIIIIIQAMLIYIITIIIQAMVNSCKQQQSQT